LYDSMLGFTLYKLYSDAVNIVISTKEKQLK